MQTEATRDSIFKGSHPGVPPGPTHRLVMNVDCVRRNDHLKADVAWQRNRLLVSGSDLITGRREAAAAALLRLRLRSASRRRKLYLHAVWGADADV